MKNLTFYILLIPSILFLLSCGKNASENEKETQTHEATKKQEKLDSLERLKTLDKISKQFDASACLDTLPYIMTYQYQNLLNNNQRVIIENYSINDIEKRQDSLYNVSLKLGRRMFIEFICSKSQISNFYPEFSDSNFDNSNSEEPFLILKLNYVKKIKMTINSYGEDNGDDEPSTYINLENSRVFMCKGEFVGFFAKP